MLCNFEPNFVENFLWESGVSTFGHVTFFRKAKIRILAAILKPYRVLLYFFYLFLLLFLFAGIWL